jgi:hypothetical protein
MKYMDRLVFLVVIGVALFIAHEFAQNGRYQTYSSERAYILDTRTGQLYRFDMGEWIEEALPVGSKSSTKAH